MKFKLSDTVTIDAVHPEDFLCLLDENELDYFYQCLACQEEIIKHVADQIVDGWTENGSHGSKICGVNAIPSTSLDESIRRIAKQSSEISNNEILKLETELLRTKEDLRKANNTLDMIGNPSTRFGM